MVLIARACSGCGSASDQLPTTNHQLPTGEWFVDRAAESGLDFVHFNGMAGEFYYPEVMPPGVAFVDVDNDGDLDVFAVQGTLLGGKTMEQALRRADGPLGSRLFRNELQSGSLKFVDVTEAAGIGATAYGMGVAAGDFDNDGCVDLYLTNLGANQLLRNDCDGTFSDVTSGSGTADPGWSVSAAFVDIDRDGWLDLFVGHYLNYTVATNIRCFGLSGQTDYCPPHVFRAQPSHLFRNNRNGTFTDITAAAGLTSEFGAALGIATADYNGDGWIDLYVANDGTPNHLWINQRNGTFKNTALLAGAAVSPEGLAKASMGVDAGDFDNDGDEDIFIGELTGQGADLYVNDGLGVFTDQSARSGLRLKTLPFTGFGTAWLDYDNDGLLDLSVVNGAVTHTAEALARNERFALGQRRQLFRNTGGGRFEDVSERAGTAFAVEDVGRGAAFGDVDNDGDVDILVGNDAGPLRLLINQVGQRNPWVGVRAVSAGQRGRDELGARVAVIRADGSAVWRRARADGSYASANDPRVVVGLDDATAIAALRVQWPTGEIEEWPAAEARRYHVLVKGRGRSLQARRD
jgi:enediyne biosynthesis protein E4